MEQSVLQDEQAKNWQCAGIEDALSRLELLVNEKPLNAAKALFSRRSGLELQMATFATTERLTFLDISNAMGTIKELVDAGEVYIKKIMLWRVEFGNGMERHEAPECQSRPYARRSGTAMLTAWVTVTRTTR